MAAADETGALSTQYTYDPFGTSTATGGPDRNAFQYTGRENNGTGLYYYRARSPQALVMRFYWVLAMNCEIWSAFKAQLKEA